MGAAGRTGQARRLDPRPIANDGNGQTLVGRSGWPIWDNDERQIDRWDYDVNAKHVCAPIGRMRR
ncbi:hypothetical protein Vau01_098010 [Virgisporangium aurantiacum]|uniref:Uncharacterized protein n=1 Tax=Virgisporangium aurantiacum TaxID=175570 RepID=A0A8J3ZIR4_9ACTN|nr:hypothetical protein Vau01_098010 [Virgisporangium aurantiacum]